MLFAACHHAAAKMTSRRVASQNRVMMLQFWSQGIREVKPTLVTATDGGTEFMSHSHMLNNKKNNNENKITKKNKKTEEEEEERPK